MPEVHSQMAVPSDTGFRYTDHEARMSCPYRSGYFGMLTWLSGRSYRTSGVNRMRAAASLSWLKASKVASCPASPSRRST